MIIISIRINAIVITAIVVLIAKKKMKSTKRLVT